jgi:hypothetical protein
MKTLLIAVLIVGATKSSLAQQVGLDTIRWNTIEFTDLNTNVIVPNEIYFISSGSQTIEWFQNNGQFKVDFTVSSVSGNWVNLAVPGSVTFQITDGIATGTLLFTRSSSTEVFIELHLRGTTSNIDLRYKISNYSKL